MDDALVKAAMEAQLLMGHCPPAEHIATDRRTIWMWSWDVDVVRQALAVPANALWDERVFELEVAGLASFTFYCAPVYHDADGTEHEYPGWEDQPRDAWGSVGIHPHGVLRLADLYGRPYVRLEESPAVLAHWQLVQAERAARSNAPYDRERLEREWPERAMLHKAWLAQWEHGHGD